MKFHRKSFGWEYAWQEFATERGGTAEVDASAKPSVKNIQLPLNSAGSLTLTPEQPLGSDKPDVSAVAFYPASDNFVFALHTEKFVDQVGKLLGMQDIHIGDGDLDARFVIQSNDPNRFKAILLSPEVRQLLLDLPEMTMRVYTGSDKLPRGGSVPAGHHAVYYKQHGVIETYEQLEAFYGLVSMLTKQAAGDVKDEEKLRPRFAESLLDR
jgi:hypothetical protein